MTEKKQPHFPDKVAPLLVVVSGPSGVGKDAVLSRLKESGEPYFYAITATTRPPRPREKDSVDYYFLSPSDFQAMKDKEELLEWARVYDHWYGVPRQPIRDALDQGRDVIVKTDVQGAATIKGLIPEAVTIFIMPPSLEELELRLRQRHSESPQQLKLRIDIAREEMTHLSSFDYVVVNYQDGMSLAASQIKAIITAEKCRPNRKIARL